MPPSGESLVHSVGRLLYALAVPDSVPENHAEDNCDETIRAIFDVNLNDNIAVWLGRDVRFDQKTWPSATTSRDRRSSVLVDHGSNLTRLLVHRAR